MATSPKNGQGGQKKQQQKKYHIKFKVTFKGKTHKRELHSDSKQWREIQQFPGDSRQMPIPIVLPDKQFSETQVLPDQVRAIWLGPRKLIKWAEAPAQGPAGIVIILESPHNDEYDPETDEPIAPLNTVRSRCNFLRQLRPILDKLQGEGIEIPNGDIVLCNPVPFQASLGRLYRERRSQPWPGIRDRVWKNIYEIDGIRGHFESRLLDIYKPKLVINACTVELKGVVRKTLEHLVEYRGLEASLVEVYHLASWNKKALAKVKIIRKATDPLPR